MCMRSSFSKQVVRGAGRSALKALVVTLLTCASACGEQASLLEGVEEQELQPLVCYYADRMVCKICGAESTRCVLYLLHQTMDEEECWNDLDAVLTADKPLKTYCPLHVPDRCAFGQLNAPVAR